MARKNLSILLALTLGVLAVGQVPAEPIPGEPAVKEAALAAQALAKGDRLAFAWKEAKVTAFLMAHNPLIQAHRNVTNQFVPTSTKRRLLEHTELFTGFSLGGTEFRCEPVTVLAGTRLSIALVSPKEVREFTEKRLQHAIITG